MAAASVGRRLVDPQDLHVVLLSGGGERASNYQSHLVHVRTMRDALLRAGVPSDRIAVFASDGEDPAADLAVRELRPEGDGWLLEGTRFEGRLMRPMELVSTEVPGARVRPATRESLRAWLDSSGRRLRAGDTLLLFVTDHGTRGKDEPGNTRITLWGKDASLTMRELDAWLAELEPGVRVVTVMSQCYSGGFARMGAAADGLPSGRVCGYFASTEDRPAYGCYAENRGALNVGHAVRFIEALDATGDLVASHERTLILDRTPDVPLRSSDVAVQRWLEAAAAREGRTLQQFADELLAQAWRDPATREHDIRLLDRTGQSFGLASPRSLAELDERLTALAAASGPLRKHSGAWHACQRDAAQANLERFLAENPAWPPLLEGPASSELEAPAARALGDRLIAELAPFTAADAPTERRLRTLRDRATLAEGASYRMSVRESALLRQRALLLGVAGQVYLETRATPAEREALGALESCEALALRPSPGDEDPSTIALAVEPDLPAYEDDLRVAEAVTPAWMGISFEVARDGGASLARGAAEVRQVLPGSPAERAKIAVGDRIVGPPGQHFTEPRQVREWVMLRAAGEPVELDVLHDGRRVARTLVPATHPGKLPALPGPLKVGAPAPKLRLESYRGEPPARLADGGERLLVFWATWCPPCKAALPEVAAFARERGAEVLAISDEQPEVLDAFFGRFSGEFPGIVARDPARRTFADWGVSGTPTFVLIDGQGVVRSVSTGYTPAKGLGVAGWTWSGRAG